MSYIRKRPFIFFLAPAFIAYTTFAVYPMVSAFFISFTSWNGISPQVFVGFQNYVEVFTNAQFYNQFINALKNNLTIILLNFTITVPLQLFIAYNIYSKIKAHNFFQIIIYAPQFVLSPIIYIFFIFAFDGNIGMFNQFLGLIGLEQFQRPWLGTPELGMFFVWLMGVFSGLGVSMLFFVGAMKMLDYATIESAKIDGAGYWYIMLKIVLPQIKTTIFNVYILSYIFSMTAFDYSFILGGGRGMGGLNGAYDVLTLLFYRVAFGSVSDMGGSFQFNSLGMGTTIACLLFLIIGIISFFQIRLTFRSLEEDSQ